MLKRKPTMQELKDKYGVKVSSIFRNRPSPAWLIPGLIPDNSLGYLVGKPGSTKSFLALYLAVSVSEGLPLMGVEKYTPTRTGWVLVLIGEAWSSWAHRQKAIMSMEGLGDFDLDNIVFSEMPPNPGNEASWNEFREVYYDLCRERDEDAVLVIVDTLTAIAPGVENNSNADMSVVIDSFQKDFVRQGTSALILHHPSKGGSLIRGAYSQEGGIDYALNIVQSGNTRTVEKVKLRDFGEIDPLTYEIIETPEHGVLAFPTDRPESLVSMALAEPLLRDAMRGLGYCMEGDDHTGPLRNGGTTVAEIVARMNRDHPIIPKKSEDDRAYKRELNRRKRDARTLVFGLIEQGHLKVLHGNPKGTRDEKMKVTVLQVDGV